MSDVGTRIFLRPLGTPLPLGLLGLMVASASFAAVELAWVPPTAADVVALTAVLFTTPLQMLSSVFGFLARDPIVGTGMAIQAGAWAVVGVDTLLAPPSTSSPGLGVLLITAAIALLVPVLSGLPTKLLAAGVLGVAAGRFAVTGVAELLGTPGWRTAAGIFGLVLAGLALYAALAYEVESAVGRPLLPVGRAGNAADVMSGDPASQVRGVEHEAGVRKQL